MSKETEGKTAEFEGGLTVGGIKREIEFSNVGDVRNYLHGQGISSYDFLVNRAPRLADSGCEWEVIVSNPQSMGQIKSLLEDRNIRCRLHIKGLEIHPN